MKLLAIETATEACSVALLVGDEIVERFVVEPRGHGRLVLTMVDEVVAQAGIALADIDAIAFGRGPGSFTGVRIATSVAQGLALGLDKPVLPISTLAALAEPVLLSDPEAVVAVAIDARMGEVYWGVFNNHAGDIEAVVAECVVSPDDVTVPFVDITVGVGTGWATYSEVLSTAVGETIYRDDFGSLPRAAAIARLAARAWARGEAIAVDQALPVYLRDDVADRPKSYLASE